MIIVLDSCLDLVFVMNFYCNFICKIFLIYNSFYEFVKIYFVLKIYF